MTKLVCIDNTFGNSRHLELYKVYESIGSDFPSSRNYCVVWSTVYLDPNNKIGIMPGKIVYVSSCCFITLEEYRRNKIDLILI